MRTGIAALTAFGVLLVGLPLLAGAVPGAPGLRVFSGVYRAGSLVFGGGHVILPLLQAETVARGLISPDHFLAGYGAAQALPGPLSTFAGFLGASLPAAAGGGVAGGLLCLVAIFLPSALLVMGVLPFWDGLRQRPGAQATLRGANAAVVGVLLAALYQPVWTSAVHGPRDFLLALLTFGALVFWRCPPWLAVLLAALGGQMFARLRMASRNRESRHGESRRVLYALPSAHARRLLIAHSCFRRRPAGRMRGGRSARTF